MFDPWIGSRYATDGICGIRLLILGESHYGAPEEECRKFTENVIRKRGQEGRFRFFTVVQRLIVGGQGSLLKSERFEFWEQVAFHNYVQSFAGRKARQRPTPEMWSDARQQFLPILRKVAPQMLLVLGHELCHNLPELPDDLAVCKIQHPSSRGWRYAEWQPVVKKTMDNLRR